MLKEEYKDKREKLDEILTFLQIPRYNWYYFDALKLLLKTPSTNLFNHPQTAEALEIIKELKGE